MVIVVRQRGVIIILASGYTGSPGAVFSALENIVIVPTEEAVLPQRELVAGLEPPHTGATAKALHVIDLGFRPHHIVIFAKTLATLVALRAEQPATREREREGDDSQIVVNENNKLAKRDFCRGGGDYALIFN